MLVLGRGKGSNYANRDILERTTLKKIKCGFPLFPNLIIYMYIYPFPPLQETKVSALDLQLLPGTKNTGLLRVTLDGGGPLGSRR